MGQREIIVEQLSEELDQKLIIAKKLFKFLLNAKFKISTQKYTKETLPVAVRLMRYVTSLGERESRLIIFLGLDADMHDPTNPFPSTDEFSNRIRNAIKNYFNLEFDRVVVSPFSLFPNQITPDRVDFAVANNGKTVGKINSILELI